MTESPSRLSQSQSTDTHQQLRDSLKENLVHLLEWTLEHDACPEDFKSFVAEKDQRERA